MKNGLFYVVNDILLSDQFWLDLHEDESVNDTIGAGHTNTSTIICSSGGAFNFVINMNMNSQNDNNNLLVLMLQRFMMLKRF